MSRHARNLLQIHVAVVLFGLAGLFGKLLTLTPLFLVFARVALAALALLVVGGARNGLRHGLSPRRVLALAILGIVLAVHWTTFFQSVQIAGVAVALISYSTFPVFVVFVEPMMFGTALRVRHVVFAVAVLAGIALLVPSPRLDDRVTQGVLWGVASGGTFAVLSLLNRRQVRRLSSRTIVLYQDAFAAAMLLPLVVADWPALTLRDVLLLLVLGVVCTAAAHVLFIAGMSSVSAKTASLIDCLEPVYGTLLAAVLLGERPSPRTLLGGVIVVSVALIATLRASSDGQT